MTSWTHLTRGRIEGDLISQDDTWARIQLTNPSGRASLHGRGHGPIDAAGTVITVRLAYLTEIHTVTIPQLLDFAAAHPGTWTWRIEENLRLELGITGVRYHQLLSQAIHTEAALQHDPTTTHRLLRQEQTAARTRDTRHHL